MQDIVCGCSVSTYVDHCEFDVFFSLLEKSVMYI
jgi:hypothetical protein